MATWCQSSVQANNVFLLLHFFNCRKLLKYIQFNGFHSKWHNWKPLHSPNVVFCNCPRYGELVVRGTRVTISPENCQNLPIKSYSESWTIEYKRNSPNEKKADIQVSGISGISNIWHLLSFSNVTLNTKNEIILTSTTGVVLTEEHV